MNNVLIGIVGGVGPYAGLYLAEKVLDQTKAASDQEHLPVVLFSIPAKIGDRTDYLTGRSSTNPAYGIYEIIKKMEHIGVEVAGIACNTAHAPQIYNSILEKMSENRCGVKLLNIVDEVVRFIKETYPRIVNVGILTTTGAYKTGLYKNALEKEGLNPIIPSENIQYIINNCIYDREYGIKTYSRPPTAAAVKGLIRGMDYLIDNGAEAIVSGCTEIPLAVQEPSFDGKPVIDSSLVLARALIREAAPGKLKEYRQINLDKIVGAV